MSDLTHTSEHIEHDAEHDAEDRFGGNIAAEVLDTYEDFAGVNTHLVDVKGLSSPKVCHFLNRLVARLGPGESYLEIGTWRGLTLSSAMYRNAGKVCHACDKFRFWGPYTSWGFVAKRDLYKNIETYGRDGATVHFHHMTSEALFRRGLVPQGVKVYFYDGDHSYLGTHHGIVAAAPLLCEQAVILVDDWNDPVIQQATRDGMRDAGLTVLWERELEGTHDEAGWWNGLGVFFVDATQLNPGSRTPGAAR